jgi:hypothetical protein
MALMPAHDADELEDYTVDWAAEIGTDTIASSIWTVPSGLTKQTDSHTTTTATIWVTDGTIGENYVATNQITTGGGRTLEHSIVIPCRAK